ncbi:MAG: hypothetical protein Q9174_001673 [Haloplaca sp. 1 TL-2023]
MLCLSVPARPFAARDTASASSGESKPPYLSVPPPPSQSTSNKTMSAGGSSLWKTILLPPAFALFLYLFTSYIFIPIYRHIRTQHPHPPFEFLSPVTQFLRSNIPLPKFLGARRRGSADSGDSLLGDEELEEEGFGGRERRGGPLAPAGPGDAERRLSLELEQGFKDDSGSEGSEDERGRRR